MPALPQQVLDITVGHIKKNTNTFLIQTSTQLLSEYFAQPKAKATSENMSDLAQICSGVASQQGMMYGKPSDHEFEIEYYNAEQYATLMDKTNIDTGGVHHGVYNCVVLLKDDADFYASLKSRNTLDLINASLKYVQDHNHRLWKRPKN